MRDFTIDMYKRLIETIKKNGYLTVTMREFIENKMWLKEGKICVLRHDAWIGAGAIILPNVITEKKSIAGAGSVVTQDVEKLSVVARVLTREIKKWRNRV